MYHIQTLYRVAQKFGTIFFLSLKKLTTVNNMSFLCLNYRLKYNCVSTLLLDDAFKPATPLTNGVISETLQQFASLGDISQGSLATHVRCGGISSGGIIANFLLILTVKQSRKSVNILMKLRTKEYKKLCQIFGATLCNIF